MDFFKSVFSEDPEEPYTLNPENTPPSSPKSPQNPNPNPNSANLPAISTAWTFGSTLFKTLATKSESLVENYRRDLEEFSSGLKKETATIRQVASRAVQDLPARLESGAAVAQTSLESVGQAIDNITDVIVTRGKDSISILTSDDHSSDSELSENQRSDFYEKNFNFDVNNSNNKPYSRVEAAMRAVQCDLKTYIEDPEDVEEYNEWRKGFVLDENSEEIEGLIEENPVVKEIYNEVVPGGVDRDSFWSRYFYRVYRVKKMEAARMKLVERAISGEVEEELSWDVDDDEEGEGSSEGIKTRDELKKEIEESGTKMECLRVGGEEKSVEKESDEKESVSETKSEGGVEEKGQLDEPESSSDKSGMKLDEKASSDGRNDNSDFSVVSSQPSHEEEDIGWDEFEDIRSGDESKAAARVSPSRADLRKRLSAAEEEEDLSWDTEDDDDKPIKS